MYRPPLFQEDRVEVLQALIRDFPLATLVTVGPGGIPVADLIPFTFAPEAGPRGALRAHLARANPQVERLTCVSTALVVFHGPQAYVSPAWYPSKAEGGRVVPTWNYMTVQVRGVPRVVDDAWWLRDQIDQLTHQLEDGRRDPWRVEDAPADFVAGLLRMIVGLEIPVASIEGKWKVSQNQSEANRRGVAAGLAAEGCCPVMARAVLEGAACP